jgi:hypothetical protein
MFARMGFFIGLMGAQGWGEREDGEDVIFGKSD